jgi:hypothetical protein
VHEALLVAAGLGATFFHALKSIVVEVVCAVTSRLHDFATVLAELLVAYVIYLELKAGRFSTFEAKALDPKTRRERAYLYKQFFDGFLESETLESRRTRFAMMVQEDKCLREKCHNQVILFNHLWFLLRLSPMRKRQVTSWLAHVVVPFWIMVGNYVLEKQRTRGGWTEDDLTSHCRVFRSLSGNAASANGVGFAVYRF